ncbi:MAG: DNA ligase D [Candidatus Acidiferrum sp.]|jgi:bifunctional non-homologous end joining protein LigD
MAKPRRLEEYRKKRQFDRTPEPAGVESPGKTENTFVVQKHAARRLHYDFRLAIDGTLKSWAVPKGPSLNPDDKRLAVRTEDHPLDYANFEGNIPEGSYGAGTVMVWDRGTFQVEGRADAATQVEHGEIKFSLNGEKLRGSFVIVKLKNSEKGNEWLMIKHKDAAVDLNWNIDEHDGSVLTGRVLEEIKAQQPPKRDASPLHAADLEDARKGPMPARLAPMLATLSERPFSDPNWLFEIKWDGVRALGWIKEGKLTLQARSGSDITAQYPELAGLPASFSGQNAILDGEIAVLDARGRSDFEKLQERMHVRAPGQKLLSEFPAVYFAFDLPYCDGYDLRAAPLLQRKQLLQRLLHSSERIRFSDHQLEKGKELFELAKQNELEGIIAKRIDSRYASERSANWLKLKTSRTLDAVIGGWTAARGAGMPFGSLLLGLYEGKKLRFVGHAGSGFDAETHKAVAAKLKKVETSKCPFDRVPETNEKATWVTPNLVAHVRFSGWTQEKRLRHPVFLGLREDAKPQDCRRENEVAAPEPPPENPHVVHAPPIVGKVLSTKAQIEAELFKGRADNVTLEVDGKRFRLSNLNKVYFPESGYTKRDLVAYYCRMAEYVLPFLKDRPLVLRRYPDGIKGQMFFQKDMREGLGLPDWFETVAIDSETRGEQIHYALANDRASLLYLTGLGCIDHNPWSSRVGDLEHPDYFFFDLDPSEGTEFPVVVKIAKALHEKLEELKLNVFVKTSGATGMHLYLPVEPVYSYEQLRTFAEIVARVVTAEHPSLVTNERSVAKRPAGRVLIDVQQNAQGRPLAAAYVVRAFPKAPVSTPLQPSELRSNLKPEKLNIKSLTERLEEKGDLWADFWKRSQRLEDAIQRLSGDLEPKNKKAP